MIFLKESFEVRSRDQSDTLVVALVLGPFDADCVTKECDSKQDMIYPYDP